MAAQANYDYSGIGKAEALLVFSALAASPAAWFTNGVAGQIVFYLLCQGCTWLAGKEVLILNIAVTDLQTLLQKGDFDGAFDDAFKAIHGNPSQLTKAEKDAIDAPVRAAFTKFAVFGQLSNSANTGTAPGDNSAGVG